MAVVGPYDSERRNNKTLFFLSTGSLLQGGCIFLMVPSDLGRADPGEPRFRVSLNQLDETINLQ